MTSAELLVDGFGRIRETVADVLSGLTPDQLAYRIDAHANPISWLVWHLTRVQDDHVAKAFGAAQVWSSGGWAKRFGLAEGTMETGYGHATEQVAAVGCGHCVDVAARRLPRGDLRADGPARLRGDRCRPGPGS